ncbi:MULTISPECIES: TerB family tellurite resistance protein [Flavobacteriaceae]|uniref:TerB family tellurite resistance protein n=1 Tax=Flavobacteriaceae TaxID=49546 RepID=UPI0010AE65EA|nr:MULTISPECIES: TerB family tellurite resistance protein [Flavobacteriaceae]NJB37508.1 TerB family tellurite resistance protein [Croceivirga sp. JEA036]TKD61330.1 TerB family tellurite resistance protein [Flavobacterium sp. ASW18X]
MRSKEEKLSILSELIAFAKVDQEIKVEEYDFLLSVAHLLEVKKATLDSLIKKERKVILAKRQADRIIQFHRLLLLMNIDDEQHSKEVSKLYNIGLKMGLPPSVIGQVLEIMHHYPNKMVPPKVLIDLFRAHYN